MTESWIILTLTSISIQELKRGQSNVNLMLKLNLHAKLHTRSKYDKSCQYDSALDYTPWIVERILYVGHNYVILLYTSDYHDG